MKMDGIFFQTLHIPERQALFVSPLRRCRETARILFGDQEQRVIELLAECDFGEFENKNYKELADNPHYQEWIDSNGTPSFPGRREQGGMCGQKS